MTTPYDGEGFIESQAILAAQAGDEASLAEILDKFLPGELRELMEAADMLGDATRGRLYKRHHMGAPARVVPPVGGRQRGSEAGCYS